MSGTITISSLPLAQSPSGTDLVPADQSIAGALNTRRLPLSQLASWMSTQDMSAATVLIGGSTKARSLQARFGEFADVTDYGAVGDGATDSTTAIQNAISTGLPVYIPPGTYLITNALTCTTKGQLIRGAGRDVTFISVPANFNLAALGVIIFSTGEQGPILQDFNISFVQPDTSNRASLTTYPPAIYAVTTPRFQLRNMAIWRATTGILMTGGDSGGSYIDDLQLSAFTQGIDIDGSLDSIRITRLHNWPFGCTTNQLNLFLAAGVNGLRAGRCDDLHLTDCLFIGGGTQLNLYQSASGTTFGTAVNCAFDTNGSITISAGFFAITGGYFSQTTGGAVTQTGGWLRLANMDIFQSYASAPVISVSAPSGQNTVTQVTGCDIRTNSTDINSVLVNSTTANIVADVMVSNCYFYRTPFTAYTHPTISVPTPIGITRLSMSNCRMLDKGTGAGTFISIAHDDYHRIVGNVGPGWTNSFPTAVSGVYQFN